MKKIKKVGIVDFEVLGHHLDLYIFALIQSLNDYDTKIFLPISCRDQALKIGLEEKISFFFVDETDLWKKLKEQNLEAIIFPCADLIGFRHLFKLRSFDHQKVFVFIKSYKIRDASLRSFARALYRWLWMASWGVKTGVKFGFIEFDAADYWDKRLLSSNTFFLPDISQLTFFQPDHLYQNSKQINRRILVIGAITERKNIGGLLKALGCSSTNWSVTVAGIQSDGVSRQINEFKKKHSHLIEELNLFLSEDQYAACIEESEFIWLCYSGKDVGSSAVLIDAVQARKKIIGSENGYMGMLLQKYSNISVYSPDQFDFGSVEINDKKNKHRFSVSERAEFLEIFGSKSFAAAIKSSLLG